MICEHCEKNAATIYLKDSVNGETRELSLCAECAEKLGYSGQFWNMGFDLGSFLGGMMGIPSGVSGRAAARADTVCPACGASFRDLERSGKLGCAECYDVFRELLLPSIQRIHGNVQYKGSIPDSAGESVKRERRLRELREDLQRAVDTQEFERAAALRDEIKALEAQGGDTHGQQV